MNLGITIGSIVGLRHNPQEKGMVIQLREEEGVRQAKVLFAADRQEWVPLIALMGIAPTSGPSPEVIYPSRKVFGRRN